MSHFTTLVVMDGSHALEDLPLVAEQMLAPFDEDLTVEMVTEADGETYGVNPRAKWDWYELGGRWTGYWPIKAGVSTAATGRPGLMTARAEAGTADVARKADIDFEFKQREAEIEAEKLYSEFEAVVESLSESQRHYRSWDDVRDSIAGPDLKHIDQARQTYHAQPLVQAMQKAGPESALFWRPPSYFGYPSLDRAAYVRRERQGAFATFAVLDSEGWHEKGLMGWFAVVTDAKDEREWVGAFAQMIDNLPDDTWLAVYDCHI